MTGSSRTEADGEAASRNALGNRLSAAGDFAGAAAEYARAIALAPGEAVLHFNLANVLAAGEVAGAEVAYRRALQLAPGMAAGWTNFGNLLRRLGRAAEAAAAYQAALRIAPDAAGRYNLGTAWLDLGRVADALGEFEAAAEYAPARGAAGEALLLVGRRGEARRWFEAAVAADGADADARLGLGVCQLAAGDFLHGWANYEARLAGAHAVPLPEVAAPRLRPGDLAGIAGKRVAVLVEQGFGDAIMMARYLPQLRRLGARVGLIGPAALGRLLGPLADAVVAADFSCPMMSLPFVFATTPATVPGTVPYLAADAAAWRGRLGAGRHVGIAWAGNPGHRMDRFRSLPLDALGPLLAVGGVTFHALQPALREGEVLPDGVRWHGDALGDFADTAGLVAALDLVISVDTAVAHLAGALARPVWVLLGRGADFRWLEGRADSPWYPTATLWRAGEGGWGALIPRVAAALAERA